MDPYDNLLRSLIVSPPFPTENHGVGCMIHQLFI